MEYTSSFKNAKIALANHLGWDVADLKDCEYQRSQFTKAVYVIGNDYYCAVKNGQPLPKAKAGSTATDFNWIEIPDSFVNQFEWKIYKHTI